LQHAYFLSRGYIHSRQRLWTQRGRLKNLDVDFGWVIFLMLSITKAHMVQM